MSFFTELKTTVAGSGHCNAQMTPKLSKNDHFRNLMVKKRHRIESKFLELKTQTTLKLSKNDHFWLWKGQFDDHQVSEMIVLDSFGVICALQWPLPATVVLSSEKNDIEPSRSKTAVPLDWCRLSTFRSRSYSNNEHVGQKLRFF